LGSVLNTKSNNSKLVVILLMFACAWFLSAYLHKTSNTMLFFDSGWHATVAKNLANGAGYASSYNGYTFFDSEVTTGPALIVLAAAAMALFGNEYSLPLYVASLLHLGLTLAIIVGVFRVVGRRSAIVFALSLALLLSYFESRWWHVFGADMSALLWGILGLQFVAHGVESGRGGVLVVAGFLLGLTLLSKSIGIVLLAGAGVYVLVANYRNRGRTARALLTIALCLAICLFPWQLYKTTAAVPSVDLSAAESVVVRGPLERNVVGVVQLWEAPNKLAHVKKSVVISNSLFRQKLSTYGLPAYSHLALFLASLLLMIYAFQNLQEQRNQFLLVLALATVGYWVWHLFLCVALEQKYTLYPLLMRMVLLLYWLCTIRLLWLAPSLLILWVLLGPAPARDEAIRFYGFGYEEDMYHHDLMAVAGELSHFDRNPPAAPLAACGWMSMPWPLEYVMPGSNNFIDCYQHLRQAIVQNSQTGAYQWRENGDLGFILVVDELLWAIDKMDKDKHEVMQDICAENQLYKNSYFRILECRDADIRGKIIPAADSPFLQLRKPGS
jgi:hypothetical protein